MRFHVIIQSVAARAWEDRVVDGGGKRPSFCRLSVPAARAVLLLDSSHFESDIQPEPGF
jgi:hypothetical protein